MARQRRNAAAPVHRDFRHAEQTPGTPEVGLEDEFLRRHPRRAPGQYARDSALPPELEFDPDNPARARGEAIIARILNATSLDDAKAAAEELRRLSRPFLGWHGKNEQPTLDVPTQPLFVHERLSTRAVFETLRGHRKPVQMDLFGDPQRPLSEQLRAYEFRSKWVNRMILGDSLLVMQSLKEYQGLGGQVQMVYMDPPYGVKFGSNFQPFVRKRDVKHNDDDDLSREPETVQAYRDTWELGLHSYLGYLRDRLMLCREMLHPSGSIFVQISDENVHHVREVMDEVFGVENFCSIIAYAKTTTTTGRLMPNTADYILWYSKDNAVVKYRDLYEEKAVGGAGAGNYNQLQLPDGARRPMTREEKADPSCIPIGARPYRIDNLTSPRVREARTGYYPIEFEGKEYLPNKGEWKTNKEGIERLRQAKRLAATGNGLYYVRFIDDFAAFPLNSIWTDTVVAGFASEKLYVVETNTKAIKRCILMTTDPGDLVLDPTCGSGTTAYVAEQWGRRWITMDVSRVPLALARQRLLTATFPYYQLMDEERGPAGGFVFQRKQNRRGEEVGGLVPRVTLGSIANNEPPETVTLVDRPEVNDRYVRVTGPFTVEATMAPAQDLNEPPAAPAEDDLPTEERLFRALTASPVLHLPGNEKRPLTQIQRLSGAGLLAAEAVDEQGRRVAFSFGQADSPIGQMQVLNAARDARARGHAQLYLVGFGIDPHARSLAESYRDGDLPVTYVAATQDLLMGDLLKTMRSSQVFSVSGLPDVALEPTDDGRWRVTLRGVDVFDPVVNRAESAGAADVPMWMLDTDYNGMCFHACQVFFPRTQAWDNLKRSLRGEFNESVWEHLAGTVSEPFDAGEHKQAAVKVIDARGNELLVVKALAAEKKRNGKK